MAFDLYGFRRVSDGGAIGSGAGSVKAFCHYATTDTHAQVSAAGYFNSLASLLVVGDVIAASLALSTTPVLRLYMVTAVASGVVTIAQVTTG